MNKFTFRVWNKINKRFNFIDLVEYLRIAQYGDDSAMFTNNSTDFHSNVAPQLFSGKEGADGVRIFQGDIVKLNNKSTYTKKEYWFPIYEVVWTGFSFGLRHLGGGQDVDSAMFRFQHYSTDFHVIGNIFESTIIIPKNS